VIKMLATTSPDAASERAPEDAAREEELVNFSTPNPNPPGSEKPFENKMYEATLNMKPGDSVYLYAFGSSRFEDDPPNRYELAFTVTLGPATSALFQQGDAGPKNMRAPRQVRESAQRPPIVSHSVSQAVRETLGISRDSIKVVPSRPTSTGFWGNPWTEKAEYALFVAVLGLLVEVIRRRLRRRGTGSPPTRSAVVGAHASRDVTQSGSGNVIAGNLTVYASPSADELGQAKIRTDALSQSQLNATRAMWGRIVVLQARLRKLESPIKSLETVLGDEAAEAESINSENHSVAVELEKERAFLPTQVYELAADYFAEVRRALETVTDKVEARKTPHPDPAQARSQLSELRRQLVEQTRRVEDLYAKLADQIRDLTSQGQHSGSRQVASRISPGPVSLDVSETTRKVLDKVIADFDRSNATTWPTTLELQIDPGSAILNAALRELPGGIYLEGERCEVSLLGILASSRREKTERLLEAYLKWWRSRLASNSKLALAPVTSTEVTRELPLREGESRLLSQALLLGKLWSGQPPGGSDNWTADVPREIVELMYDDADFRAFIHEHARRIAAPIAAARPHA
jgi:hypothetical protein